MNENTTVIIGLVIVLIVVSVIREILWNSRRAKKSRRYNGLANREQRKTTTSGKRSFTVQPNRQIKNTGRQRRGSGIVKALLPDDTIGDRHQRFLLKTADGQTLLIAHNIDIAPYLTGLATGDTVEFYGEYCENWNEKKQRMEGVIHRTHSDITGRYPDGYLKWNGKIYCDLLFEIEPSD
ncbi:MAG: DUF3465 domain-containing protein [Planctomycetaceae bacterium]|nr:DUF3465 domain-containing protein [Planctomycetaceae bacterium]